MGRNMIIRLGIDASDFLKKMIKAGASAESAGRRIRKSLTIEQRETLATQYNNLLSASDAINEAIQGQNVDLSRPLTRQIEDAEKAYHNLLNEAQKTKETLRSALSSTGAKGSTGSVAMLRRDLKLLRSASIEAGSELARLKQIASKIGPENMNYASHAGLKKLESELNQIELALNEAGDEAQKSESFI